MPALQQHISLKPYNTFSIQVNADFFVDIKEESDLSELFNLIDQNAQDILVLGGGSNMLFTKDFDGLVVKISIPGIRKSYLNSGHGRSIAYSKYWSLRRGA